MARAFLLIFIVVLAGFAGSAFAGAPLSGTGCDEDYWSVIGARAWMEAESDTEAAQTIITRPQSVLDLAQFECRLIDTHTAANSLFSDNTGGKLFKNMSMLPLDMSEPTIVNHTYKSTDGFHMSVGYLGIGPTHMDNTLISLIRAGLKNYFYPNFYSTPLAAPPAVVCNSMAGLWNSAKGKCANMDKANFWTFQEEINGDPRGCEPAPRSNWDKAYKKAIAADPNAAKAQTYVYIDAEKDYLNLLDSAKCSTITPIVTGLIVSDRAQSTEYPDALCPASTCWYDSKAGECKAMTAK